MVFRWSLSDSKSPQVTQYFGRSTVVWMVLIRPMISNSCHPLSKPFGSVPWASITIIITIIMFQSLFSSLVMSKHLCLVSLSLIFTLWPAGTVKNTTSKFSFLFSFFITRFGHYYWHYYYYYYYLIFDFIFGFLQYITGSLLKILGKGR